MKKNNKGFVLVETLVVTVFVMVVFSIIYVNFYPLIGEYERREFYDDVDSKYGAYWMKRFVQGPNYSINRFQSNVASSRRYHVFQCNELSKDQELCNNLREKLHVKNVYITTYKLTEFKSAAAVNSAFSEELKTYVNYLPEYLVITDDGSQLASLNNANYRVVVEFEREATAHAEQPETYRTYASMEVVKR